MADTVGQVRTSPSELGHPSALRTVGVRPIHASWLAHRAAAKAERQNDSTDALITKDDVAEKSAMRDGVARMRRDR